MVDNVDSLHVFAIRLMPAHPVLYRSCRLPPLVFACRVPLAHLCASLRLSLVSISGFGSPPQMLILYHFWRPTPIVSPYWKPYDDSRCNTSPPSSSLNQPPPPAGQNHLHQPAPPNEQTRPDSFKSTRSLLPPPITPSPAWTFLHPLSSNSAFCATPTGFPSTSTSEDNPAPRPATEYRFRPNSAFYSPLPALHNPPQCEPILPRQ